MKWRDVLVGAFVTILVTVLAGLVVWYITKTPLPVPAMEKLVFQSESSGRFVSDAVRLTFHQIRVANVGGAAAQGVLIAVQYSNKAKINQSAVSFSSGPAAGEYSLKKRDAHGVIYQIQTLVPSETVTVAMIVDAEATERPLVSVKSDKTTGLEGAILTSPPSTPGKARVSERVASLLAFVLALPVGLLIGRMILNIYGGPRSVNNAAFMYIHKGLYSEALPMLQANIREKGATGYELANYGLCLGLAGDYEKAEKHFKAAEFYAPGAGIKALVAFSRGIVSYHHGDAVGAKSDFQKALGMARKRIKRYASFSDLMAQIFKEDEDISKLFNDRR